MKYVKKLGLLVAAAAALMAFAGSAAATVITSPSGTTYTSAIKAHSEGYWTLHNAVGTIFCVSTFEGKVERHTGSGATTAGGKISKLTFTGCTNGEVHPNIEGGEFEIHKLAGGNGTFTSTGARFTTTQFGFECGYTTANTTLGVITAGEHGTLDITNNALQRTHGSFFCGSSANLTGAYKITTPTNISFS